MFERADFFELFPVHCIDVVCETDVTENSMINIECAGKVFHDICGAYMMFASQGIDLNMLATLQTIGAPSLVFEIVCLSLRRTLTVVRNSMPIP